MGSEKTYGQILKASSIMGGAAGINLLLGMVRVKFAAVFIGPTGVGLNASFAALQGLISTIAGLGIHTSGVRDIAAALGKGDNDAIGRAVLTLRRISWLTGLLGMSAMMLASPLLSQLTFGHQDYVIEIAALGLVILFGNISGGQMALIQCMRRIGDMARASIIGAAFGTMAAVTLYSTLGLHGIVPTLVAVSAFQLLLSWYYARKVPSPQVKMTWRQTYNEANSMVRLGLVFMGNGLMISAVAYITIALITKYEGIHAVGLYSAAFALSGLFVNLVLGAMGADYYPRLTATADDKVAMNRMVNEQSEIGLLLAVPGLIATIVYAPWILEILYTKDFIHAVNLLQWFGLGCLGRLISWPLGFVMLALGKGRWFLLTETCANITHLGLIVIGLKWFAIEGVAIAFLITNLCYIIGVYFVCRHLTGFSWSIGFRKLAITTTLVCAAVLIVCLKLHLGLSTLIGTFTFIILGIFCLRELLFRLGSESKISQIISALPGVKLILKTP